MKRVRVGQDECLVCGETNMPTSFPTCVMCETQVVMCMTCLIQQEVCLCEECATVNQTSEKFQEERVQESGRRCEICARMCVPGINDRIMCCGMVLCKKDCLPLHTMEYHLPLYKCGRCMEHIYRTKTWNLCPHPDCPYIYGCRRCAPMRNGKDAACFVHGSHRACSMCHFHYMQPTSVQLKAGKMRKEFCSYCGSRLKMFINWALTCDLSKDVINHVLLSYF